MIIQPIKPNETSFGYSNILKTLWKRGKLPTVQYGFYGDKLTIKNVSLEHVNPRSFGGKSELSNFVLSSKQKNSARGNKPLEEVLSIPVMMNYFEQFRGVKVGAFNGDAYIDMVLNTIYKLIDKDGSLFK